MNAIHRLALSTVALAAVIIGVCAAPAVADDEPMFSDGGSLVTPLDGGVTVTVDLAPRTSACWNMAIRCEGSGGPARYVLCATNPCPVSSANQLLDADRTFDIPVNCTSQGAPKHYLSLTKDDATAPACKVQHSPF